MPEINYTLNVDTTRLAGAMSEVRSQLNQGMVGGLGGAYSGLADFGGAATAAGGMMVRGLQSVPTMQAPSYMDMAMASQPHYGVLNAQASIESEWLNQSFGPRAITWATPPGVAATEYGGYMARAHATRITEAVSGAAMAAGGTIATLAGGEAGALAGGGIARLLGRGTIGKLVGTIGGALIGGSIVAEGAELIQRGVQESRELGEIADARRGLPVEKRRELGMEMRHVAEAEGRNVNEIADLVAGLSKMGMMPKTTEARAWGEQIGAYFREISAIANEMHTSLGQAMGMMRGLERFGFKGTQGLYNLIGTAAAAGMGVSPTQVYGIAMGGAHMAEQAQIGGRFGFNLAEQSLIAATHSDMTREEMRMAGGVVGLTRSFETAALQHAFGGAGQLQMLAMGGAGGELPATLSGQLAAAGGQSLNTMLALAVDPGQNINMIGASQIRENFAAFYRGAGQMVAPGTGEDALRRRHMVVQSMFENQGYNAKTARALTTSVFDPRPGAGIGAAQAAIHAASARVEQEREVHREHMPQSLIEALDRTGVWHAGRMELEKLIGSISMAEGRAIDAGTSHWEDQYHLYRHPASREAVAEVTAQGAKGWAAYKVPGGKSTFGGTATTVRVFGGSRGSIDDLSRAYTIALGAARDEPEAAVGLGEKALGYVSAHPGMLKEFLGAIDAHDEKKAVAIAAKLGPDVYTEKTGFQSQEKAVAWMSLLIQKGGKPADVVKSLQATEGLVDVMTQDRAHALDAQKQKYLEQLKKSGKIDPDIAALQATAKFMPHTAGAQKAGVINLGGGQGGEPGTSVVTWDRLDKILSKHEQATLRIEAMLRKRHN